MGTCKHLQINPFVYLRDVIERVSTHPARLVLELTPGQWKAPAPGFRRASRHLNRASERGHWCVVSRSLFAQDEARLQLLHQRLGVLEIGGIEAFGEPIVDFGEHRPRFLASARRCEQARKAYGCAQFPRFGAHLSRKRNRLAEIGLDELSLPLFEPQFAAEPESFRAVYDLLGI